MWRNKAYMARRKALADIAIETRDLTTIISGQLPNLDPIASELVDLESLSPLDPTKCPGFIRVLPGEPSKVGTLVRVFNKDALDTAISMPGEVLDLGKDSNKEAAILDILKETASHPDTLNRVTACRVAVLNMASEFNPGGGWLKGSTAQEEAICYRSTLAASLHREKYYPISARTGIYTQDVVILRSSMGDGHQLLVPETPVGKLPTFSAVSVAGMRRPALKAIDEHGNVVQEEEEAKREAVEEESSAPRDQGTEGAGTNQVEADSTPDAISDAAQSSVITSLHDSTSVENKGRPNKNDRKRARKAKKKKLEYLFAREEDRDLTKDKMRLCLRMAASNGHTMLVLGAIGCGAFRNPPKEIASCWMEVLKETEFAGGWFKEVWFAVFDRRNEGNFEIFEDMFDGKMVGVEEVTAV
ncbi:DUF2263 domain containing protein [Naviculisporaceae sp. PSN 640]